MYRVVTKDGRYSVQERWFGFFWKIFTWGVHEGGGGFYISEDSAEAAEARYLELRSKGKTEWFWKPVGGPKW